MADYTLHEIPKPCYIFDIDGTIADLTHRRHHVETKPKNWPAFHAGCVEDKPFEHVCELARALHQPENGRVVIFMTGRNEAHRMDTVKWLHEVACLPPTVLYMRADGDFRDDSIIKLELLEQARKHGYVPIMAFDDRDRVVKMWRENGIPCAQVAPGDF